MLNFRSCPFEHVIYLKLRRKWLLLQSEQVTKWQLFSLKMTTLTVLSEIDVNCAFAQLVTTFIFFSAWDKSRVKWDNSQNTTQKMSGPQNEDLGGNSTTGITMTKIHSVQSLCRERNSSVWKIVSASLRVNYNSSELKKKLFFFFYLILTFT